MADSSPSSSLQPQLDELVRRGRSALRRHALRDGLERSWTWLPIELNVVPLLYFLAALLGMFIPVSFLGNGVGDLGALALATLTAPFVLIGAKALVHLFRHAFDRRTALSLFDRQMGAKDRLQAADEFLRLRHPTAFQTAAIADASSWAARAVEGGLKPLRVRRPLLIIPNRNYRWAMAAPGLIAAGLLLNLYGLEVAERPNGPTAFAKLDEEPQTRKESAPLQTPAERQQPSVQKRDTKSQTSKAIAETSDPGESALGVKLVAAIDASAQSSEASGSRGAAQAGRSGNSQSSTASNQGKSPRTSSLPKPARTPSTSQPESQSHQDQEKQKSSSVTEGSGSSSRSRAGGSDAEPPDAKAQPIEHEEDALDEVEDEEDEEQQASGGARPLISQRKAPSDRSLSPSAESEGENEAANGRGGAGGLKKTRGVAAMLLGVPLPDQLQGQVNRGRVKLQRERDAPKQRDAEREQAQGRGTPNESIRTLPSLALDVLARNMVRNYFLATRSTEQPQEDENPK